MDTNTTDNIDYAPAVQFTSTQILITDSAEGVEVEMRTSNVSDTESPANILCAFLAKYWEVICQSAQMELAQAQAERDNPVVDPAPLRLVNADGTAQRQRADNPLEDSGFDGQNDEPSTNSPVVATA